MKVRKRIFIGCEGASERSYVRWLQGRADELGKSLHFDAHIVGGGDPLGIVEESASRLAGQTRKFGKYAAAAVLLDSDRLGQAPQRDAKIASIARGKLALLFQEADHEAFLLRHFPKCKNLRPPPGKSIVRLRREWPTYKKPADALELARVLGLDDLRQVCTVEREFDRFLSALIFR